MKINISEQKQKLQTWWKDKAKPWLSKNGEKVIAGTGVALGVGAVVAAVVSGRKSSSDYTIPDDWKEINPLVIDLNNDDWKDKVNSPFVFKDTHEILTVRQAEAVSALDGFFHNKVMTGQLVPEAVEASIADEFCKLYPEEEKVLNGIEGFWGRPKE